ncbi:MAG: FadR/GntR family transcriptional regulator [Acetobacteraceae bacterium]
MLARRQRLSDQLYGQIFEQITSGRLGEGERLPPEIALCRTFGVSRPVVREALQRLGADGLIRARQGSGTYVMARPAARVAEFADPGEISGYLRCMEVRIVIEAAAARYAAERRSAAALERIAAAHREFTAATAKGVIPPATDVAFHHAIAAASGNEFFLALLGKLEAALTGLITLGLRLTETGVKSRAAHAFDEHALILEAIAAQDPDAAETAMRFHLSQSRRRMIDRNRDR